MFGREVIGEADDLVGEKGVGGGGLAALPGFFLQPPGDFGAAGTQRLFQQPGRLRLAARAQASQLIGQGLAIDDRAAVADRGEAGVHGPEIGKSRGRWVEHTPELQSTMRIQSDVICLKKKTNTYT